MSLLSSRPLLELAVQLLNPDCSTKAILENPGKKPSVPVGASRQPLPTDRPEAQGVSSRQIAGFLQALSEDPTLNMHSVLILRHGRILCRAAFGAQPLNLPRQTFSACKSITALAVGLAMDDGLLHRDDLITELFDDVCPTLSRRLLRKLTVEHLLTMTTSITFNEASSQAAEDWVRGYLSSPGITEPGKKFSYNSLNTYMLAAAVVKVTGRSLCDYLQERLFTPMGIHDYHWDTCPKGIEKGGWGLYMLPEDLAKLGLLVQQNGQWNGRQLISQGFLETALQPWALTPEEYGDFNYGWQIWVGRTKNTFLFNGMFGQNVLCDRDNDLIFVSHAGNSETFQQSNYFSIVRRFFDSPLPSEPLPRDRKGERMLSACLRTLSDCQGAVPSKKRFAPFDGLQLTAASSNCASAGLLPLILQAVESNYSHGLEKVSIGGSRKFPKLIYQEKGQSFSITAGTKKPLLQEVEIGGSRYLVSAQVQCLVNEDGCPVLRFTLLFPETPCTRVIKVILTPKDPVVRQQETPGADFLLQLLPDLAQNSAAKAIVNGLIGSHDTDYIRWRVRSLFDQTLLFRQEP